VNRREAMGVIGLLTLAACGGHRLVQPSAKGALGSSQELYEAWAQVLERHVDLEGRVDFVGLTRDSGDLDRVVRQVAVIGPESRADLVPTGADAIAFHINAYNALAMWNVVARGVPAALTWFRRLQFFGLDQFTIDGRARTLYRYENDVIRPLGEERVHFALNCMTVSCPRLPRTPFRAATLQDELEREARHFLNDPRNIAINHDTRRVRMSAILDWYAEDFERSARSLLAYVNRYRLEAVPEGYEVAFLPYNWTINRQRD
jgi:Protein of unknown function, DUF547